MTFKVLVTCPPMLKMLDEFMDFARAHDLSLDPVKTTQALSEQRLVQLLPHYDGWIIGDDPATRRVLIAGKTGRFKAAVKWGIGVDNVDFLACKDLNIPITNTPMMFGAEVADIALAYIIGLARQIFYIDREIRTNNSWPKPAGMSLQGKNIGVIGYGDIGRNLCKRLIACDMNVTCYDPYAQNDPTNMDHATWPNKVEQMDFLVFTCSLNEKNRHMLNADVLAKCKKGVQIVNVARGPLIDENALIAALQSGHVQAAALDVFEEEPLPLYSALRAMTQCVFGSHNSSNTKEAVRRASFAAIKKMQAFLSSNIIEEVI